MKTNQCVIFRNYEDATEFFAGALHNFSIFWTQDESNVTVYETYQEAQEVIKAFGLTEVDITLASSVRYELSLNNAPAPRWWDDSSYLKYQSMD